jgi:hypothetical protein
LVSCHPEHISSFQQRKPFFAVIGRRAKKAMSKAEYSFDVLAEICRLTRLDSKLFLGNGAGVVTLTCRSAAARSARNPASSPLGLLGRSIRSALQTGAGERGAGAAQRQ